MEIKQRQNKPKEDDMAGRKFKRTAKLRHQTATSNPLTWKLCLFLVSIPVVALYIGYAIGNYLMPPARKFPDQGVVVDIGTLNYSLYNTHNVTIDFVGGLGNQMFEYAALYGIAKANGLKPVMTSENRLVDLFPSIKAKIVMTVKDDSVDKYSHFNEFNPSAFDGRTFSLNFMKNVHLEGFFQSWRYFDHVRSDIRRQFSFRKEVRAKVNSALGDAYRTYIGRADPEALKDMKKPIQFVGLHIRRGDNLEDYNVEKGYTTANRAYIHRAIDYFEVTYKNVIFIVCTDDEEWTRENVVSESPSSLVVLSPFLDKNPTYDLCVLAFCNHTIVTVGTFGWWGAWLAAGDVVYYRNFPKPFSELSRHFSHSDFYIPQWIPL